MNLVHRHHNLQQQQQQQHLATGHQVVASQAARPTTSASQQPSGANNLKPAHSYIGLIAMCILSSPDKRMVLNDIYQYILDNYPYYRNRGSGWRNSVRHNLSLNECFQKACRAANGKGHYWTIHPANMEDFMLGDFRRRRAQRKVRRWNNMDVASDESDDESMEDASKPALPEHFKRSLEMHRRLEVSFQKSIAVAVAAAAASATTATATTSPAAIDCATPQPISAARPNQPSPIGCGGGQASACANSPKAKPTAGSAAAPSSRAVAMAAVAAAINWPAHKAAAHCTN